jgi:hypothetical protein
MADEAELHADDLPWPFDMLPGQNGGFDRGQPLIDPGRRLAS